jgi:hypothetical protein
MAKGTVLIYLSELGLPLRAHQRALLTADARALAKLKQYDFGGQYDVAKNYARPMYFIPDDTLLVDEAQSLGIQGPTDLYGGVVPHPFVKTKAITHPLVDTSAEQPAGWSLGFAEQVHSIVLLGYTAFTFRDVHIAARRMLARGAIRMKESAEAGGRGQTLVTTVEELEAVLEHLPADEVATYGLVLEENLHQVTTLSIGHITVDSVTFTYHGTQRVTMDNDGQRAYGGSDLVCVRGGWDALDRVPMTVETRLGVKQARLYDEAMSHYPGFIASRRNYDVGQGLDDDGRQRSAVFEASWRVGGATGAEVMALTEFARDPSARVVEASHVEEFGGNREAPRGAVTHFQGDDPQVGPMIRYTILRRIERTAPGT